MTNRDVLNALFAMKSNSEVANILVGFNLSCSKCLAEDYCKKVLPTPLVVGCRPYCVNVMTEWLSKDFTTECCSTDNKKEGL